VISRPACGTWAFFGIEDMAVLLGGGSTQWIQN